MSKYDIKQFVFVEKTYFDHEAVQLVYKWHGRLLTERRVRCVLTEEENGRVYVTWNWLGDPGGVRYSSFKDLDTAQRAVIQWANRRQRMEQKEVLDRAERIAAIANRGVR